MTSTLAIDGGTPVRAALLPYNRQWIGDDDIKAVTDVLRSDWLTTGPNVSAFEEAFAAFSGAKFAVAVNNGTSSLHAAIAAVGIGPGDEVILPAMTFASTANVVVFQGATPVFIDCDEKTLLASPEKIEAAITKKTKAIVVVDYAGQPCDYPALRKIAEHHGIPLIADACHALGGSSNGIPVGTLADLSTFSFHAVKPLATGEGGMITTNNEAYAKTMRSFRNHGITSDHRERHEKGSWFYEMTMLGNNYRLTDFQCALGMSQLKKVPEWTTKRQNLAALYDKAFAELPAVEPLLVRENVSHAYHLYVVQLELEKLSKDQNEIFQALRKENIGVNVHYIPVYLHPYYRDRFGFKKGLCPITEKVYERILSIPMFAKMEEGDVDDTVKAFEKVTTAYAK